MAVYPLWIEDTFRHFFICPIRQQAAVVTTVITGMTCRATMLDHADQQAILLAIHKDLPHLLHIARLLALAPDRIAGPAEKMLIARLARAGKRFFVHERHHHHLVCRSLLYH